MRVMVIVKATKSSEQGILPSQVLLAAMGDFNEKLVKAGVMLAGAGLHPSHNGNRVRFSAGNQTVVDGPFAETKEFIAGSWIWQVKSMGRPSSGRGAAPTRCRGRNPCSSSGLCSTRRTSAR